MTVKRKEVFFFDGKTAECVLASDYDALAAELASIKAHIKFQADCGRQTSLAPSGADTTTATPPTLPTSTDNPTEGA